MNNQKKILLIVGLVVLAAIIVVAIVFAARKNRNVETPVVPETVQEEQTDATAGKTTTRRPGTVTEKNGVTITESENGTVTLVSEGKKVPFSRVLGLGESLKCNVNYNSSDYKVSAKGTVYLGNYMMRGEFKGARPDTGGEMSLYTIIRDGYAYNWTSIMSVGYKTAITRTGDDYETKVSLGDKGYAFNTNQVGDYTCFDWDPDSTIFNVPPELSFNEIK